jgi:hypothetical protein
MNDSLISLYIDNELDLDEKITFVETVHADGSFAAEATALLKQEKRLRMQLEPGPSPAVVFDASPSLWQGFWDAWAKPLAGFATALLAVTLVATLRSNQPPAVAALHRFVVYLPETHQAQIVGTFTDWRPVDMEPIGASGYWSLTLQVPRGEHRYSYLVDAGRHMADPTEAIREQDDFGGENSVIEVRAAI